MTMDRHKVKTTRLQVEHLGQVPRSGIVQGSFDASGVITRAWLNTGFIPGKKNVVIRQAFSDCKGKMEKNQTRTQ
jgi:hypothetical protein